jgi:hypothetical protein
MHYADNSVAHRGWVIDPVWSDAEQQWGYTATKPGEEPQTAAPAWPTTHGAIAAARQRINALVDVRRQAEDRRAVAAAVAQEYGDAVQQCPDWQ